MTGAVPEATGDESRTLAEILSVDERPEITERLRRDLRQIDAAERAVYVRPPCNCSRPAAHHCQSCGNCECDGT